MTCCRPCLAPGLLLGPPLRPTRRQACLMVLLGAAAVALPTGCTSKQAPPPVDANRVLLESAYLTEAALLALLESSQPSSPSFRSQATRVLQEHLDQLVTVLGAPVAPAVTSSADGFRRLCPGCPRCCGTHLPELSAADPPTSQLLSSLAASDLVLAQAFQGSPGHATTPPENAQP